MKRTTSRKEEFWKQETIKVLFRSAELASKQKNIAQFLSKLLTESEQLTLGRRLTIARMLMSGLPQTEIRNRLGVGPNTVWKVSKWLAEELPEYGAVIKKVELDSQKRKEKGKKRHYDHVDPLSFSSLRRKYPMHFLLFNIAEALLSSK